MDVTDFNISKYKNFLVNSKKVCIFASNLKPKVMTQTRQQHTERLRVKELGEMLVLGSIYAEQAAEQGNTMAYRMYERLYITTIKQARNI